MNDYRLIQNKIVQEHGLHISNKSIKEYILCFAHDIPGHNMSAKDAVNLIIGSQMFFNNFVYFILGYLAAKYKFLYSKS